MSIKYNSTSMSSVKYNGITMYSVKYNGSTYCVSCSYDNASCGVKCLVSFKTSSCGVRCTTALSGGGQCNANCSGSVGLNRSVTPVAKLSARLNHSATLLGKFAITPHRSEYLLSMTNEVENWEGSYLTYYQNEDIPQETQEEVKRLYDEMKQALEEDKFVLEEEIKLAYPAMKIYAINYEENTVYVYGD